MEERYVEDKVLADAHTGRRVSETRRRQKTHCHCSFQLLTMLARPFFFSFVSSSPYPLQTARAAALLSSLSSLANARAPAFAAQLSPASITLVLESFEYEWNFLSFSFRRFRGQSTMLNDDSSLPPKIVRILSWTFQLLFLPSSVSTKLISSAHAGHLSPKNWNMLPTFYSLTRWTKQLQLQTRRFIKAIIYRDIVNTWIFWIK